MWLWSTSSSALPLVLLAAALVWGAVEASMTAGGRAQTRRLQRAVAEAREFAVVLEGVAERAAKRPRPDPVLIIKFPETHTDLKASHIY